MRALVVGGAGFIGSHLVDRLLENGHFVRVLDRSPPELRPHWVRTGRVEYVLGDFVDHFSTDLAVKDIDIAFHTVSTTIPATSPERQAASAACSPGRFMLLPLKTSCSIRSSCQPLRSHSSPKSSSSPRAAPCTASPPACRSKRPRPPTRCARTASPSSQSRSIWRSSSCCMGSIIWCSGSAILSEKASDRARKARLRRSCRRCCRSSRSKSGATAPWCATTCTSAMLSTHSSRAWGIRASGASSISAAAWGTV